MNRHPPGYGFGMVVSMLAGMAIAGGIWHIGGGSFGILTFLVGLVIAPLIWALLRPLFLVLGALPGYLRRVVSRVVCRSSEEQGRSWYACDAQVTPRKGAHHDPQQA